MLSWKILQNIDSLKLYFLRSEEHLTRRNLDLTIYILQQLFKATIN
jgi:hypothetical protein